MELIGKVLEWPAIIQGVLGSALFAIIYWIMRKIYSYILIAMSNVSKKRRIDYLHAESIKYRAALSHEYNETSMFMIIIIFGALGSLARAALSITIGMIAGNFWSMLEVVGFCFAIYFLFESLANLKDIHSTDTLELQKKQNEIEAELKKLEESSE